MSTTTFLMRWGCKRSDKKRDQGLTVPDGLTIHKDISYGPHKMQLLDVYRPSDAKGPMPVIVSVHGGGWVYGDKELYRFYCMDLATRGFAVVNFTYRLSPEHTFPCHLEDTALAFRWVAEHAAEYGFDLDNLFAVGDSAGGHLLALYGCLCTDPAYAASYPFTVSANATPKAIALNCGVYDFITVQSANSNTMQLWKDVLGHRPSQQELTAISPAFHIAPGFPACYVMTANEDFLKDQPASLLPALEAHHIPYEYHCFGDDTVKLGHVFHLNIRTAQAIACNDAQCQFFRSYMQ